MSVIEILLLFPLILKIEFIVNFRFSWIVFTTSTNMKAVMIMCLLYVSCFAEDYPTTPPENVENDDEGHDNSQYETGDSMQLIGYGEIVPCGLGLGSGGMG